MVGGASATVMAVSCASYVYLRRIAMEWEGERPDLRY